MNQSNIVSHQEILQRFSKWVEHDRLASTYLFVGPDGVGKRLVAIHIARCLLCEANPATSFDTCGQCSACQQVDALTHPDLFIVQRPADKNTIPLELLIGDDDKRMREGLCHDISLKPFRGGRRIAIIDDADFLSQESANCLLKTLEEPPPRSLIILIATSEQRQLPTIRSRCQTVRFSPLSTEQVSDVLRSSDIADDAWDLNGLAASSGGSIQTAIRLADPDIMDFRTSLLEQLATLDPGVNDFANTMNSFVESAGKEASVKRDRMRMVCDFATEFFRHLLVSLAGIEPAADSKMSQSVAAAVSRWSGDPEQVGDCIDRCIDARCQIAANVNQATFVGCWLSDLGRICRGEVMPV